MIGMNLQQSKADERQCPLASLSHSQSKAPMLHSCEPCPKPSPADSDMGLA
jgi:hypothetical protein